MIRDTLMLVLLAGGTIGCLSLIVAAFIAPSLNDRAQTRSVNRGRPTFRLLQTLGCRG
jgi:hypothetical protein